MRPAQVHQQRRCQRNFAVGKFAISVFNLCHTFVFIFVLFNKQCDGEEHFLREFDNRIVVFAEVTFNEKVDSGIIVNQIEFGLDKRGGNVYFFGRIFAF